MINRFWKWGKLVPVDRISIQLATFQSTSSTRVTEYYTETKWDDGTQFLWKTKEPNILSI